MESMNERAFDRNLPRVESFPIASLARADGCGRIRHCHEGDSSRSKSQHVLGDDIASATVIDADKIVMTASGVGNDRAIEQDNRNPGVVESARDPLVDIFVL